MPDPALDLFEWWNLDDSQYAGPAEVERLARLVVGDVLNDEWLSAVLETCDATWEDEARFGAADLPMRVGGWRLDLGRTGVRTGLMASIVAGALVQQGVTQMVIGVVAAVIPSVLDIERVALSPRDRMLLLEAYDRMATAIARGGTGWTPLAPLPAGKGRRHAAR